MSRFHINPDTGNANQCDAKIKCRFNLSEEQHFATKEDAAKSFEYDMEAEQMNSYDVELMADSIHDVVETFYTTNNGGYEQIRTHLSEIHQGSVHWSEEDKRSIVRVHKISKILATKDATDKELEEARKLLQRIPKPMEDSFGTRKHGIYGIARGLYAYQMVGRRGFLTDGTRLPSEVYPERKKNPYFDSGKVQQYHLDSNLRASRSGRQTRGRDATNAQYENVLNGIAHGASVKKLLTKDTEHNIAYAPPENVMMYTVESRNDLYMATVWTDNELREEMETRKFSGNLSVKPFTDGVERGNAYSVKQPDGTKRTFAVYEHPSSDDVVISGATEWDGESFPSTSGSRREYFALFQQGQRKETAEHLVKLLQTAQQGKLVTDTELLQK